MCKGRSDKRGGGVALYIRNELQFTVMNNLPYSIHLESLFVNINNIDSKNIVVGVIYRPPGEAAGGFLDDLVDICNKLSIQCEENK